MIATRSCFTDNPSVHSPATLTQKPLQVLLLGPLRVSLQTEVCELACPVDGSQAAFWSAFFQRFPHLELNRSTIRLARDGEFLQPQDRLKPGDLVALIPPVSGG